MKIFNDERGFASAVGICWLAIILFFGGAIYSINESETRTVNRFLLGRQLQLAAEDGVLAGCQRVMDDAALQEELLKSSSGKLLLTYTVDDISCEIYGGHKGADLAVLAVSRSNNASIRCLGFLKKVNEKYIFDHREH